MSKIIYAYTTETYREFRGWLKVGETKQESAQVRVQQQDGTACPEPLEIEQTWDVPDHISDHTIHAQLKKMGCREVRLDKDREWFKCTTTQISSAINDLILGVSRPNAYPMRDEQKECHDQAVAHYLNGGNKFLMNAKMRFGKTFTSYQILKSLSAKRALVITYKPAVDANWREDLDLHVEFDGWTYNSAKDFSNTNPIILPQTGNQILFTSFQDFNDFDKNKWSVAKHYHYDFVIIDEMHYGTKTERAQTSLAHLKYDKILYVSGTPLKALMSGEFLDEEIYTWGYADEQEKRTSEKNNNWETEIYRWLPVMHFHTFEVCEEAKKLIPLYTEEEGFTMTKMFGTKEDGKFIDESSVKLFIDQIFGRGVKREHSPVKTHAVDHMLMVMPPNVDSVTAFSNMLAKMVGDEYQIINVAGDNVRKLDEVKDLIADNKKSITVTCGRFNTGVTVPEWDMVMMIDDGRSPETYFQTVFRCQSPDKSRSKEDCYVVDFNPQRCLSMIYEFADITAKKNQSTQESLRKFLDFASVLDHSGNKPVEVDIDVILNMMSETGGYAERFGSSVMVNWSMLDKVKNKFLNITPEKNTKKSDQLSDNDLEPGKNYQSNENNKTKDSTFDELKDLKRRVITMMRRLPTYLFLEENKIDNVDDIINNHNKDLFTECVGITIEDFKDLCNGFIRKDRLDRCIMSYNQIEKM